MTDQTNNDIVTKDILKKTVRIMAAFVANNHLPIEKIPVTIITVYRVLASLTDMPTKKPEHLPAPLIPMWNKDYRLDHKKLSARRKGKLGPYKLDTHKAFIHELIENRPDITLTEISAHLEIERGIYASISTVKLFLDREGLSLEERRRREMAGPVPQSLDEWMSRLSPTQARMLVVLKGARRGLTREELAERASISTTSSFLGSSIRKMNQLGLIEEAASGIKLVI